MTGQISMTEAAALVATATAGGIAAKGPEGAVEAIKDLAETKWIWPWQEGYAEAQARKKGKDVTGGPFGLGESGE